MVNTKNPSVFPPPKTDKPRPHVCNTCQRSFARLEHLKRHERSHTKEKPFECPECARCFARRDLLLRHQQKLHQTTTPSSRPRNRRESASGVTPGAGRVRKNSVVGPGAAAAAGTAAASMRPRANTISHVDGAAMQMIAAANAQAARMAPTHSRHPSLIGLPTHHGLEAFGMASALAHRGAPLGLPKLETHGINGLDFSSGLRTAPAMAFPAEFELEGLFFSGSPGSTINPNALHYNDSPPSMAMDPLSPFAHAHGLPDMSAAAQSLDDAFDWVTGFDHQMSFNNGPAETAVDGSSPSALSTTSQSGISDVMVDGSNHHTASAVTSSMWQPSIMGPPQLTNPFSLDMSGSVFPDLLNGAPLSPQPTSAKTMGDSYFSTPPPSLNSLSPSVIPGLNPQNLNQALSFGAGPETPSSMNGSNHGTLPVSTITDSTRNAILGALSASQASQFGTRRYSFATPSSPLAMQQQQPPTSNNSGTATTGSGSGPGSSTDYASTLPSTHDLRRHVGAYLRYYHPHQPFVHIPTLTFEIPAQSLANARNSGIGGSGCLLLSMAAIGALFELEHQTSMELFGMAKKMIQLYLDERRKANVRKAESIRRTPLSDHSSQQQEPPVETPVWLVQAMLLNVIYGHNCGDKRSGEIASTHAAALVSLAQGAELLRPMRLEPSPRDVDMVDADMAGGWSGPGRRHADEHAEWLRWKSMEERKRTLYAVFIMSSLLVSAYNHSPALTNSEILLDLPCDEQFFAAENAAAFQALGGIAAANHNRMTFHEALGQLLRTNEKQQNKRPFADAPNQLYGSAANPSDLPESDLKPSSLGSLVLINALHNYIWETRQRHHNKVWTNEETEKMHRHIEPALRAWHSAWANDPHHSPERPNPYGAGPLSADCLPLLDLAYVRLFVNLSRSKERFWQRDWDGMAEELAKGSEIIQHAEHSPTSNADSGSTGPSSTPATNPAAGETPPTQSASPDFGAPKLSMPGLISPVMAQQPLQPQPQPQAPALAQGQASSDSSRSISRREKHLRKAAFFAAETLSVSDKLGVTFANLTSRELPLQATLCAFDCAQVLAEWVATLQDRVGRYLGILGRDGVDLSQVPAIMLLEDEDVKLLGRIDEIIGGAEAKMSMDMTQTSGVGGGDGRRQMDDSAGYATKLLRVTAYMFDKATVWPGKCRPGTFKLCSTPAAY